MKGVRKTSLLYIIPLIAILAISILCGNVYAQQSNSGGTYVTWGHIYPPGGTYHYHIIGYFAWAAEWDPSFRYGDYGVIYMGGTEGTTSWYCGGQQWWSEPNVITYKIEVIKIKDLTTQTEYTDPSILESIEFDNPWVRPKGSADQDTIANLLLDIAQGVFEYFTFPIPIKFSSTVTNVGYSRRTITVYGSGDLSEFYTKVVFVPTSGLPRNHTYEVTCRLTWTASFSIWVEGGLLGRNPIEGEGIISPESSQAVDIAYAYATMDITFIVMPPS
jgi:hypothetical protein